MQRQLVNPPPPTSGWSVGRLMLNRRWLGVVAVVGTGSLNRLGSASDQSCHHTLVAGGLEYLISLRTTLCCPCVVHLIAEFLPPVPTAAAGPEPPTVPHLHWSATSV